MTIAAPGGGSGPGQGLDLPTQILRFELPEVGGGNNGGDGNNDDDNDNDNNDDDAEVLTSTSPHPLHFFPGTPLPVVIRGALAILV